MDQALQRIRPDVRALHAYAVQDAAGLLKMDAMENPHRLSPALQAALGARLGAVAVNRYPGAGAQQLQQALAAHIGLPHGHRLILGNGSDELISLVSLACAVAAIDAPHGLPPVALAPLPGFVMYGMSAQLQGLCFVGVPLTADFELDLPAMLEAIERHRPAITYLAYPNNPTANLWSTEAMHRVIGAAGAQGGLVVIDEAYQPFSSRTWLDAIRAEPERHGHVLLMRTLSKFGLAGVRLGYLVGPAALIDEIDKVRPPYNVSVLNSECALFALEHADVFEAQARDLRLQRDALVCALRAVPGASVWNSEANMVLLRIGGAATQAAAVFDGMKARGVLVKNVSTMHPLLAGCLRLTVGTAAENAQMLAALQAALADSAAAPPLARPCP